MICRVVTDLRTQWRERIVQKDKSKSYSRGWQVHTNCPCLRIQSKHSTLQAHKRHVAFHADLLHVLDSGV